jgi:hypothetical protein
MATNINNVNTLVLTGDDMKDIHQVIQTGQIPIVNNPNLSRFKNSINRIIIIPNASDRKLFGTSTRAVIGYITSVDKYNKKNCKWRHSTHGRDWNTMITINKSMLVDLPTLAIVSNYNKVKCQNQGGIGYCEAYFKL